MDYNYYLALVEEAGAYADKDTFVGAYGYSENCPYAPENLQRVFYIIYAVSSNDFLKVASLSDLNFSKFHAQSSGLLPRNSPHILHYCFIPCESITHIITCI